MTDEVETDLHEVRDEELLEAYKHMKTVTEIDNVALDLASCGAVGLPQTHPELMEVIEKELKERGI